MDGKEKNEILWQLHSIGEKLDPHYRLNHYVVTDATTVCEKYVIEYNHRKATDGTDPT